MQDAAYCVTNHLIRPSFIRKVNCGFRFQKLSQYAITCSLCYCNRFFDEYDDKNLNLITVCLLSVIILTDTSLELPLTCGRVHTENDEAIIFTPWQLDFCQLQIYAKIMSSFSGPSGIGQASLIRRGRAVRVLGDGHVLLLLLLLLVRDREAHTQVRVSDLTLFNKSD